MPKAGVNIHKRKDGRWEGRYKVGVYPNGATKYKSVYGISYTEAKDKLFSVIAEKGISSKQTKERTFSEILQLWLCNNRLRQKGATEHKYRTIIDKHIEPEIGSLKLSKISAVTINSFLERKLKFGRIDKSGGLSSSYVRTMASIIQSALQFAVDEGYCQPLKSTVCKPPLEKKDLRILTKDEQEQLEAFLYSSVDLVGVGIMISLYAGLRIGEICALSWEDIDLASGIIHIRHTIARVPCTDPQKDAKTSLIVDTPKTKASLRDIPISSLLQEQLATVKSSTGFILTDSQAFVSPRTYEYRFHKVLDNCGIDQVNYHTLRHTFATRCIEAGVDVKSLSEMLGHANVGITLNTYVHPSMDLKRLQLEKLHSAV
jgi:integrase